MSLVTKSEKRDRVYDRAFDHEEAQRLRTDEGWPYTRIAEEMGVSARAVRRVCDPKVNEQMHQAAQRWARNRREPCKGGCGTLVYAHGTKERTGFCTSCWAEQRAASHVRPDELCCRKCGEWKPDAEFPQGGPKPRRGRRQMCRPCATAARRDHRARNREQENAYSRNHRRRRMKLSTFIVLEKTGEDEWKSCGQVQAASRMHAVEQVAERPGTYAATTVGQLKEMVVEPVQALKVTRNGSRPE